MGSVLFAAVFIALHFATGGLANPDAKRLYDDLLSNYNRLIRPVGNNSDRLTVKMGLRLSQLIDVEWNDYKLKWNPDDYGGVDTLHVPSEHIWLPDIVLYNNADGNYEVTIMTKAILHHTGKVVWKPPAIYKSFCEIDVEYFPFDEQTCFMKFGSWTYDGYMVDLRHLKQTADSDNIEVGIDLQDYYISVEWDIMRVPAVRNEKFYSCCEEPYLDIVFNLTLRRKTLFYTVNLIIPCVGISFLSVLVFYLPSDSGEKISLCISILLSLTVFFLLLAEIIPPTSLTVPLLGKYLLFTMMLVTLSVVVTIAVLNVNFRSPVTHRMAPWVQRVFIKILPKLLCIERPKKEDPEEDQPPEVLTDVFHLPPDVDKFVNYDTKRFSGDYGIPGEFRCHLCHLLLSIRHVEEDWKYVAMVLDRMFLWIFAIACVVGTALIILQAPSLYDQSQPIDILYSKIAKKKFELLKMGSDNSL
ncbi:PREDICTED: acetylcholine receptor subunit alpha-like 1 [Drosophila arizonae]|uniref:Acetylcholine receptor subunit alpha-like 1 n=1 Tax=Drosophila arizonae TaxID=7263 RepID=A0ABM1Q0Z1_DROAR|nr:PREDICTED: acetylcholine receptor subunit alpha-like 1 [Drosophila arizonae]